MEDKTTQHPKINICGIGPGHPDYILPKVFQLVAMSDCVIGGARHLAIFDLTGKETIEIRNNIPDIIQYLKARCNGQITLLVSGDAGFHSLLNPLLAHFTPDDINVVPGISSFQYLFAKLGMTYHDAWIGSIHGKQIDYLEKVKTHPKLFLLTDAQHSWKHIAFTLANNHMGDCVMYVGNRLSYPDEVIVKDTANGLVGKDYDFQLCAVVVAPPNLPKGEEKEG